MLEVVERHNTWEPEPLSEEEIREILAEKPASRQRGEDFLFIFKTKPYIDALYAHYSWEDYDNPDRITRFTFHEGFCWSERYENLFLEKCLNNDECYVTLWCMDEIYKYYSWRNPQWHLKRHYTKPLRMLDHIYHCMKQQTLKEMLYKSGLDEIAQIAWDLDDVDLSATKPSEIFEGLSMRSLRTLNCRDGAAMLVKHQYREFLIELQKFYPGIFKSKMNDAQCRYLRRLIDGGLTVGEAGRLYLSRCKELAVMWSMTQCEIFLQKEDPARCEHRWAMQEIREMDPIYDEYFKDVLTCSYEDYIRKTRDAQTLKYYLLVGKDDYNSAIRRANRRRSEALQERKNGYVVRFPQTINDFCREAIYMRNCLLSYIEAWMNGDTTILFLRRPEDVNKPFIDIEIYGDTLKQAYHRFNYNCTPDEAQWIREYCARHGIKTGDFSFGEHHDDLF